MLTRPLDFAVPPLGSDAEATMPKYAPGRVVKPLSASCMLSVSIDTGGSRVRSSKRPFESTTSKRPTATVHFAAFSISWYVWETTSRVGGGTNFSQLIVPSASRRTSTLGRSTRSRSTASSASGQRKLPFVIVAAGTSRT